MCLFKVNSDDFLVLLLGVVTYSKSRFIIIYRTKVRVLLVYF